MRFLKSKHILLTVLFLSCNTTLCAQAEMDFFWATNSTGYGLNQTDHVIELYSCELPSFEFVPYARISISDIYKSPNFWTHYRDFIYGFSNSNEFTRVERINWQTKKSLGGRILHPEVATFFNGKLFALEKASSDGVVLISSAKRKAVILDLENNNAYYATIPGEVAIDSIKALYKWVGAINPKKLDSTYAYRGINLMEKAFALLGILLALLTVVLGGFSISKRKKFWVNKKELFNPFKKTPITIEMYHFLNILSTQKEIKNQELLDLFFQDELTQDSILKRKNKMLGDLIELTNGCFKIQLFKKKKDPSDRRETIYFLNPEITIKVTK